LREFAHFRACPVFRSGNTLFEAAKSRFQQVLPAKTCCINVEIRGQQLSVLPYLWHSAHRVNVHKIISDSLDRKITEGAAGG